LSLFPLLMWEFYHSFFSLGIYFEAVLFTYWTAPSLKPKIAAKNLKSQIVTSSWGGRRKLPFAFTEHGVIMLSSVLNSRIATKINIAVVKAFIDMRRYITQPVHKKIKNLEKILMLHVDDTNHNFSEHAKIIKEIIDNLNNLIAKSPKTKRIGFTAGD